MTVPPPEILTFRARVLDTVKVGVALDKWGCSVAMQGLVGGLKTLARGATVTVGGVGKAGGAGGVGKAGGAGGVGKAGGAGGVRQLFSKPPSGTQGRLPTDVRQKNKTTLVSFLCTLYSCFT